VERVRGTCYVCVGDSLLTIVTVLHIKKKVIVTISVCWGNARFCIPIGKSFVINKAASHSYAQRRIGN